MDGHSSSSSMELPQSSCLYSGVCDIKPCRGQGDSEKGTSVYLRLCQLGKSFIEVIEQIQEVPGFRI